VNRRLALGVTAALLPIGWLLSLPMFGMTGHMAAHMSAVAIAAPLLAWGLTGGRFDPARRWRVVTPMNMMLVELATVWLWHLPALRALAQSGPLMLAVEQLSFLAAGYGLWSAVLAARNKAAGVGALLLTSMHMTLLGVLIGLAPRTLYGTQGIPICGIAPLPDQQLGGVVMLAIGAASYLIGGLVLLAGMLRHDDGVSA